jgi:hypothetical protein
MDQASPANPHPDDSIFSIASDFWHQHMTPGLLCSLLAVVLGVWLLGLLIRPRSLASHIVFLAASLFPALLGIISGCLAAIHFMLVSGNGGGGPSRPAILAADIGEMILYLLYGSLLTCVFLISVLSLLIFRFRHKQISSS